MNSVFTYWFEIFLIGVSLSMDALAVSVALATAERTQFTWKKIALVALFFGGFQALMPLIGWFGGNLCGQIVQTCGRYIAAALLAGIGAKMIHDRNNEENVSFSLKSLTVLAFATSIDALLVGVSFACLGQKTIGWEVALIGLTTASISIGGCLVGRCAGSIFGNKCEVIGGSVLILIALKILFLG